MGNDHRDLVYRLEHHIKWQPLFHYDHYHMEAMGIYIIYLGSHGVGLICANMEGNRLLGPHMREQSEIMMGWRGLLSSCELVNNTNRSYWKWIKSENPKTFELSVLKTVT